MSREMTKRVHEALADENLQSVLGRRFVPGIRALRQMSMAAINFDALSKEIHRLKEESIANLPQLV